MSTDRTALGDDPDVAVYRAKLWTATRTNGIGECRVYGDVHGQALPAEVIELIRDLASALERYERTAEVNLVVAHADAHESRRW